MEFLDEYESKPRFMFHSKNLPQSDQQPLQSSSSFSLSSLHKPTLFVSLSLSLLLLSLALIYFNSDPLKSILLWLSLSLLLGPFAPPSLTAGDIRVGLGPPLPPAADPIEIYEKPSRKSTKPNKRQSEDAEANSIDSSPQFDFPKQKSNRSDSNEALIEARAEEWGDGDDELLKKLMGRHPVGKPGRWEAIAEGFKGRHKVETVIAKAKNIGEKKGGDLDSYAKFLKDRKPVQGNSDEEGKKESGGWSAAEDLALLNALKAFPKEVAMRWEKVAASVPGKTKAACVARMAELKKDFRSSKASASAS